MPRDEWMEYVETPASVSRIELAGTLDPATNSLSDICCVIDTAAKKVFVDIFNCNNVEDVQTSINSIPGWNVEHIEKIAQQPACPDRVEFLFRVYPDGNPLPTLLVRDITSDGSIKVKAIPQAVYKVREHTLE